MRYYYKYRENYLFVDLAITPDLKAGKLYRTQMLFSENKAKVDVYIRKVLNAWFFSFDQKEWKQAIVSKNSKKVYIDNLSFDISMGFLGQNGESKSKGDIKTQMPGKIIKILVESQQAVQEGQTLLVIEAMKMENEIKSPCKGRVKKILVKQGDSVEAMTQLLEIEET